jgi:hypothetical protein
MDCNSRNLLYQKDVINVNWELVWLIFISLIDILISNVCILKQLKYDFLFMKLSIKLQIIH